MSKYSRFFETTKEDLKVNRRETLKRWGANAIRLQKDYLAVRAFDAKTYFFGGLQDVCRRAGKDINWIHLHIYENLSE